MPDAEGGVRVDIVGRQDFPIQALLPGITEDRRSSRGKGVPAMTRGKTSIGRHLVFAMAAAVVLLTVVGCGEESAAQDATTQPPVTEQAAVTTPASSDTARPALSDMARAGEELFNANCSLCHGGNASGTEPGPNADRPDLPPGPSLGLQLSQCGGQGRAAAPLDVRRYVLPSRRCPPMTWRRSSATSASCSAPTASSRVMPLQPCAEPKPCQILGGSPQQRRMVR